MAILDQWKSSGPNVTVYTVKKMFCWISLYVNEDAIAKLYVR